MKLNNITDVRRLAVAAVGANLLLTIVAAVVLPRELLVVLPIVGLTLPLLTTAFLEAAAERRLGDQLAH
jgi:Flp pilus assembly protein TadB